MALIGVPDCPAVPVWLEGLKLEFSIDDELPCDGVFEETGCSEEPEWIIRLVCCPTVRMLCTECKDYLLRWIEENEDDLGIYCASCGADPFPDPIILPV